MSSSQEFLSQKNEAELQRVCYKDICRRIGGDLNEKQARHLLKTVKHYMGEVHRVEGDKSLNELNYNVIKRSIPDYIQYIQRAQRSNARSAISDMEEGPGGPAQPIAGMILNDVQTTNTTRIEERSQLDVSQAFAKLQASRQEPKAKAPLPTDFRISLQDEGPVNMSVFERMKQEREQEALRVAEAQQARLTNATTTTMTTTTSAQGQLAFAEAGDVFASNRRRMDAEAEAAFAERERKRLEARALATADTAGALPLPPDMRGLLLGDRQTLDRFKDNRAAGNPTLAFPERERDPAGGLQQMIIPREPETMTYRENELNLFVYSADRDWTMNSNETRYNFTVNFDPSNMPTGLRLAATSTVKFRNIVRIELVKAILPGESVDTFVTRTYNSGFTYSAPYNMNVLTFPYVQVRIPELDNNNFGTNLSTNSAFGILQYDANWVYDTSNTGARGYFAMIPKFLKCQKIYTPTPLATLQKLTFRFERPDGTLVSATSDTVDIAQIYSSKEKTATSGVPYGYDSSVENGTGAAYYFIKTSTYFNSLVIGKGDRILLKNTSWSTAPTNNNLRQANDFLTYIQQDSGVLVVDIGYGTGPSDITIGANKQGYANFLIVRGKFTDPTTGTTVTSTLAGIADNSSPVADGGTLSALTSFLSTTSVSTGRILNLSKQVQIVLRVITREMDSTGILRPDNL